MRSEEEYWERMEELLTSYRARLATMLPDLTLAEINKAAYERAVERLHLEGLEE